MKNQLRELREHWAAHSVTPAPVPISQKDPNRPGRDWLPEPDWISGWDAVEILRLQTEPYEWAPAIARNDHTVTPTDVITLA